MAPKKGDSKSAAKKGKSDEPKKGGKDDKKGAKDDKKGGKKAAEPPAKGKGKEDGKKGTGKKPVSESEEVSEEEEEEVMSEEQESDDSEEEAVTKKTAKEDKGKAKAALKGASKAMAMKPKRSSPAVDEEEDDTKRKPQVKKGMDAVNLKKMSDLKGASKSMLGLAAQGQKKNLDKKVDATSHLKGASKVLSGIAGKSSPFSLPSKQAEKAKPKRNLKSTSRLFLRLSKKKKPPTGSKPLLGNSKLFAGFGGKSGAADKKPALSGFSLFNKKEDASKETPKKTLNLSNLGSKGNKMASEAKGLGGKFKGMFGKKKTGQGFKSKSWMVGRMAAASNWLTGRFLSTMGHGRLEGRAGRRGKKNLSHASRDTRGGHTHHYNEAYEYDDDYGYEEDYQNSWGPQSFERQTLNYDPTDPYGEQIYYDDEEWEDELGYYDDAGNFYFDDGLYYDDDVDNYGYPYDYYDEEYEDYHGYEETEYYYGKDGFLYSIEPDPYGYYDDAMYGFHDLHYPEQYMEYFDHNMASNYGLSNSYGIINGTYDGVSGVYNDPLLAYSQSAQMYNPYQQHVTMNPGLNPAETAQLYGQEQFSSPVEETSFPSEQFRVPRPQVMLFGKERLEVETLPQPPLYTQSSSQMFPTTNPSLALNNQEIGGDVQFDHPIPAYISAQSPLPTDINQQLSTIPHGDSIYPTAMINHQEYLPSSQLSHMPLSFPPNNFYSTPIPPQFSSQVYQAVLPQDLHILQLGQISAGAPQMQQPIYSPLHSPMVSPMPVRKMSPLFSPQLSLRPGSQRVQMSPSPHFSPHPMDLQSTFQSDPYIPPHLHRHSPRASMASQRPKSPVDWQRKSSPPSSPPLYRRRMSVRAQPSLKQSRQGIGLPRGPSTARPHSPLSSSLASPQQSLRKRQSPPSSPRLSFRQQPPPDAVHLPPMRPHLFKGRKQTSIMRRSPSPPLPSPQSRSPVQPDLSRLPRKSFRPTSPYRPTSPSPSHVSARPLPSRSSTRRLKGGPGVRSHVPMGAVKPSPANPHFQRRSRPGPPVTQQVAPFRSSIHRGPATTSGEIGSGTTMLARSSSRPAGLRETKRVGGAQGTFHRPVGRGQPLVRTPRSQPSLQSRQSLRVSPAGAPASPQPSLKQSGPVSPQPSVRRLQSRPQSPQPLQHRSPLPSRSASPMYSISHPASPLPHRSIRPQSLGPAPFQPPVPQSNFAHGVHLPSQSITQFNYTLMEPGPSPMLTNALPGTQILPQQLPPSPILGRKLHNPYLQNAGSTTPLQRIPSPIAGVQGQESVIVQETQMANPYGPQGLSASLMQHSRLRTASFSSPLQHSANLRTTVLSPLQTAAPQPPYPLSSPHLSSAMLNTQLRNASFASPLQRHLSPASASPAPSSITPPQGSVRGSSPLFSGGLRTSQIQGSMFKLPSGTLTMSKGSVEPPGTNDVGVGASNGRLSASVLSNALQNPNLRQATYRVPDGSLITRNNPAELTEGPSSRSSPMLSSALLNSNVRKATYRLPDGTLVTRNEPAPVSSSPMLSSAILNANVRKASYRLPDGSLFTHPGENTKSAENSSSSFGLSSALMNTDLRNAKFQLPEGSSLFSRNQPQNPSSPLLSGALLNSNIRGASYNLPNSSLLRQHGSAATSEQRSLDLSNALRNQNLRTSSYRLPDGTLMAHPQATSSPQSLDLSKALSKNPNLRGANYRLPEGNIMTRLGKPSTPQPLNLSGALQKSHLQGSSFRLPSYAVVSPHIQGAGPEQHWAHGSGAEGMQEDLDVWGAERVLPHGTVENLNKWSMYGDGELLEHTHSLMRQRNGAEESRQWNLNREGEPQGQWYDKVTIKYVRTNALTNLKWLKLSYYSKCIKVFVYTGIMPCII